MIDLFSGTPGSGKSLHVAKLLYEAILDDRPCIGNFFFNGEACRPKEKGGYLYLENDMISPEFFFFFSSYYRERVYKKRLPEDHILLVIDEAQLLFNTREWGKPDRKQWVSFFSQHRKLGYHVILVAQYSEMLDKQVRALFEYEYLHRKVGNIGKGGALLSGVSGGGLHVCVKMYRPLKMKVGSSTFHAEQRYYSLYDSYTIF